MSFLTKIKQGIVNKKSHICVGLDSDYDRIPEVCKKNTSIKDAIFQFNKQIIDATVQNTAVYKANIVFYAGFGIEGLEALIKTNQYIKSHYPDVMLIADSKRSEMARSAVLAARELFDKFLFDATTVTPWFGFDTIQPFINYSEKAVFILCHDSNPSAGDLQDLVLDSGEALYEYLTRLVTEKWNSSENIFIEAPLTYPEILNKIYTISDKKQFFLLAGLGSQGGDIEVLRLFKERKNFIVNASRSIIFASTGDDFAQKAAEMTAIYKNQINDVLNK